MASCAAIYERVEEKVQTTKHIFKSIKPFHQNVLYPQISCITEIKLFHILVSFYVQSHNPYFFRCYDYTNEQTSFDCCTEMTV